MKVRLGDYISEYSVRNKNGEDIPVYSVTNTQGFCRDFFGKEVASKDKSSYKIVPKGCFAYNPSRINVGSVDWQRTEDKVIVSPLYNVFSVSPQLDNEYLYYFLKSDVTLHFIKEIATGSVRDNLKLAMLYEFPISLPSLKEQRRIVHKLCIAKTIIDLKKQELTILDKLIKARFIEEIQPLLEQDVTIPLADIVEDDRPITYGIVKPGHGFPGGVPVVKVKDMQNGIIDESDLLLTSPELDYQYRRSRLRSGDLLISIRGSVGRMAEIPASLENANITQDTARLSIKPEYNKWYIRGVLESPPLQYDMEKNIRGVAVKGINIGYLRQLKIPVCSRAKQDHLAQLYQQSDKSKVAVQKSLEQTQLLFDSLMQKYFG